jgi:hypothetical protein
MTKLRYRSFISSRVNRRVPFTCRKRAISRSYVRLYLLACRVLVLVAFMSTYFTIMIRSWPDLMEIKDSAKAQFSCAVSQKKLVFECTPSNKRQFRFAGSETERFPPVRAIARSYPARRPYRGGDPPASRFGLSSRISPAPAGNRARRFQKDRSRPGSPPACGRASESAPEARCRCGGRIWGPAAVDGRSRIPPSVYLFSKIEPLIFRRNHVHPV